MGNDYRECKEILTDYFAEKIKKKNIEECEILINITTKTWKGDIDNCIKILLDSLESAQVIKSDKLIKKITIKRDLKSSTITVKELGSIE